MRFHDHLVQPMYSNLRRAQLMVELLLDPLRRLGALWVDVKLSEAQFLGPAV